MTLNIRLLGALEVSNGRGPVVIGGSKQRGLLALLAVNAGRVVPYGELTVEVWPAGQADKVKPNTLHAQVNRLRLQMPELPLRTDATSGYVLDIAPDDLDVNRFHQLRGRATSLLADDPAQAMVVLRKALKLWRGSALHDCAPGRRCQAVAAGLEEARLQAHEQLAQLAVAQGDPASALGELQELAVLHPMRAWAVGQGIPVSPFGVIPNMVRKLYIAAMEGRS